MVNHKLKEDKVYDVILMDIEMPIMGGIATATELRRWEVDGKLKSHIPVIAVTGNARREHIERGSPYSPALMASVVCGNRLFHCQTV
jgi:CheY-like chemotaxis protein